MSTEEKTMLDLMKEDAVLCNARMKGDPMGQKNQVPKPLVEDHLHFSMETYRTRFLLRETYYKGKK